MTRCIPSANFVGPLAGLRWCALWLLLVTCFVSSAFGQAAWEYSPYEVRIWLALPDDPTWNGAQVEQLRSILIGRAETALGPVWNTKVERAPDSIATVMRSDLGSLKVEQVQAAIPGESKIDKIYLI